MAINRPDTPLAPTPNPEVIKGSRPEIYETPIPSLILWGAWWEIHVGEKDGQTISTASKSPRGTHRKQQ